MSICLDQLPPILSPSEAIRTLITLGEKGDPQGLLHKRCKAVTNLTGPLEERLAKMHQVMKHMGGIGIAAPQVGIDEAFFIIDIPAKPANHAEAERPPFSLTAINPKILQSSREELFMIESCLSIPGYAVGLKRPRFIQLAYQDIQGFWHEKWLDGMSSRATQHETDHTSGILTLNKVEGLHIYHKDEYDKFRDGIITRMKAANVANDIPEFMVG